MVKLFKNAKIITSGAILASDALLEMNGVIIFIGSEKDCLKYCKKLNFEYQTINCNNNYLTSGFIDLHCHGGGGYDFMDGDVESIVKAAQLHLKHGTTSIYPTTLTCDNDTLFKFFENYREALKTNEEKPNMLGLHLEGPFFAASQSGAQDPETMQLPTIENVNKIWEKGKDIISRWSIAAELEGALEAGKFLSSKNIHLAIGHSNATYKEVEKAIECGYKHVTHLYSGMSTITRENGFRVLGLVESSFLFDELTVEIIADGKHLPPELLQLILKTKNHDKICLVTDSMRAAGQKNGFSILGCKTNGLDVLIEDGIAKTLDKTCFAGSIATTDHLVRTMVKEAKLELPKAVQLMNENPAKFMQIDDHKGKIEIGYDADIIIFNENIEISQIYILGNKIGESNENNS
jgi:N-acetylglucosamine-6-phosphate deacetylase